MHGITRALNVNIRSKTDLMLKIQLDKLIIRLKTVRNPDSSVVVAFIKFVSLDFLNSFSQRCPASLKFSKSTKARTYTFIAMYSSLRGMLTHREVFRNGKWMGLSIDRVL
jgi:hypothetical protein